MTDPDTELAERFAAYDRWLETLRAVAEDLRRSWPELAADPAEDARPAAPREGEAARRSVP